MMRDKSDLTKYETLISQVNAYLKSNSMGDFYQGSYLVDLLEAFNAAIKKNNLNNVVAISDIFSQVIKQDPVNFSQQLSKDIYVGLFQGQSYIFTLVDLLYSAVLMNNSVSSLHVSTILSELLKVKGHDFIMALMHPVQDGINKGMNPYIPLIEALLFSAKDLSKLQQTKSILDFLIKIIHSSPKKIRPVLILPFQYEVYSGQMLTTYLINLLDLFAQEHPDLVKIVTDELSSLIEELSQEQVQVAFSNLVKEGPDGGTNAIDLLLSALRTSCFAIHNDDSIKNILSVIKRLYNKHPDLKIIMIRDIVEGDKENKNGATMLVEAMIKASNNQLNIVPLCDFLEELIRDLGSEMITKALQKTIKYGNTTYIDSLSNYVAKHPEMKLDPMKRILSHVSKTPVSAATKGFFVEGCKETLDEGSVFARQESKP